MKVHTKLYYRDWLSIGVFALGVVIFFHQLVFQNMTFYARDISQYYRPTEWLASESIQRGVFPFWNPYVSCGRPFFAFLQHGLLYPLNLLSILFSFELGFKYNIFLHFFLGGLFLYLLNRKLQVGIWAGLGATFIFCFSGVFVSLISVLTTLRSFIWLAVFFLFFTRQAEKRTGTFWLFLSAMALAMQFFSGQPEIMYMSFVLTVIFSLGSYSVHSGKFILRRSVWVLVFTFLLVCVEIIPFSEVLYYSSRLAEQPGAAGLFWALSPGELVEVLLPGVSGTRSQEWLESIYIGILPLVFFIIGLYQGMVSRRRTTVVLVLLGGLFLVLSCGEHTPFYRWLMLLLPGLMLIRYQVKFILGSFFIFVLITGWGLHTFFQKKWGGFLPVRIGIVLFLFIQSVAVTAHLERTVPVSFFKEKGKFSAILEQAQRSRYAFTPLTMNVITDTKRLPAHQELRSSIDAHTKLELLPNYALMRHWYLFQGYESMQLDAFAQLLRIFSSGSFADAEFLLHLAGVKYLVSFWDISSPRWRLYSDHVWKVYEFEKGGQRAFITRYDFHGEPLSKKEIGWEKVMVRDSIAEVFHDDLNELDIRVRTGQPGFLIVNDTYYPGWRAFVDGVETDISPAAGIFRKIVVESGEHVVRLRYLPRYFTVALLVSVSAFLWVVLSVGKKIVHSLSWQEL